MTVRVPSPHKYHATPKMVDGHRFASQAEAKRYTQLRLMERAGGITGLTLQPRFALVVNGVTICHYVADFQYQEHGAVIIEDVKGMVTPVYTIKKKLMRALLDIEIREVAA